MMCAKGLGCVVCMENVSIWKKLGCDNGWARGYAYGALACRVQLVMFLPIICYYVYVITFVAL